jgi:splicing factor 3A subunit 1
LKQLAERRTDIFGVGEEAAQEAEIGKKMGEEDRRLIDDKIQWDGHTSSAEATARAARANISLNDQIEQIHRAKGLIPDSSKEGIGPKAGKSAPPGPPQAPKPPAQAVPPPPQPIRPPHIPQMPPAGLTGANLMPLRAPHPQPMMMPPQPFYMAPQAAQIRPGIMQNPFGNIAPPPGMHPHGMPQQQPNPPGEMGEPPAKRMRGEESLIPESEFMARNHSPVTFKIVVPNMSDKPGKVFFYGTIRNLIFCGANCCS